MDYITRLNDILKDLSKLSLNSLSRNCELNKYSHVDINAYRFERALQYKTLS